jgi:hypothetical protein
MNILNRVGFGLLTIHYLTYTYYNCPARTVDLMSGDISLDRNV